MHSSHWLPRSPKFKLLMTLYPRTAENWRSYALRTNECLNFALWLKLSRDRLNERPLTSTSTSALVAMIDALACSFCIVFILGSAVLSMLILAGIWWRERSGESQLQVVVLGDAGRSPRMQYHCLSLVQLDYNVDLVAYGGNYAAQ